MPASLQQRILSVPTPAPATTSTDYKNRILSNAVTLAKTPSNTVMEAKARREALMAADKAGNKAEVARISQINQSLRPQVPAQAARTLPTPTFQQSSPTAAQPMTQGVSQPTQPNFIQRSLSTAQQSYTPTSITSLVQDALNKRIAASKGGGFAQPIQEAMINATAGPDIRKFPGYENLSSGALMNVQRVQNQGLTDRLQGLFGLQKAFGTQQERELENLGNIYKEQNAAKDQADARAMDLIKLQADLPAGMKFNIGGQEYEGLKAPEEKATRYQAVTNPITGETQVFDPSTGQFVGSGGNFGGGGFSGGSVTGSGVNVDDNTAKSIFYQSGKSDYGHGEGKRECGEGYNDITEGAKVGNSYASKMATVTKRDNPQVGNGLILPLKFGGGVVTNNQKDPGHIETVISVSPTGIKTVSWNRDGKGTETIQNYTYDQLKQFGTNWGFSDSQLKPQYANKLQNNSSSQGSYQDFYNEAISGGATPKAADALATERLKEQYKAPTEAQTSAATYAERMQQANDIFDNLEKKGFTFTDSTTAAQRLAPASLFGVPVGGAVKSNELKQQEQAERNFINATLRRESGSAIAPSEFESAALQYFPQYGDTPEVLAQKKQNRLTVINGLKRGIGGIQLSNSQPQSRAQSLQNQSLNSVSLNEL